MFFTKFVVISLMYAQFLATNPGGVAFEFDLLDDQKSRNLRLLTKNDNEINQLRDDDSDFRFLVTGGYRPENNPLAKFLVSLRFETAKIFGSNHICGGSILSKKAIVTAAHCISFNFLKLVSRQLTVVVGTPRRLVKTENTQELRVEKLIQHPKWGVSIDSNDVGIVKLKDEIRLDDNFASVIPLNDRDPIGLNCTVIGWGIIIHKGPVPDELISANVTINSPEFCFKGVVTRRRGVICASDPNNYETGPCYGDSGGPLICDGKLVGIVSFGTPGSCGIPKAKYFFTDVSHFHDWIVRNAGCSHILQVSNWFLLLISAMLGLILKIYSYT